MVSPVIGGERKSTPFEVVIQPPDNGSKKSSLEGKPQVKRTTYYPPLRVEWTTSLESTTRLIRYCNSEASRARRGA